MRRRGAFTLIELLMVLTVSSLITGLAIQVVERALVISTRSQKELESMRCLNQLCDQVREDLRLASSVREVAKTRLAVQIHDDEVIYNITVDYVERLRQSPSQRLHRERYAIGKAFASQFESTSDSAAVTLTIIRNTELKHIDQRIERMVTVVPRTVETGWQTTDNKATEGQP